MKRFYKTITAVILFLLVVGTVTPALAESLDSSVYSVDNEELVSEEASDKQPESSDNESRSTVSEDNPSDNSSSEKSSGGESSSDKFHSEEYSPSSKPTAAPTVSSSPKATASPLPLATVTPSSAASAAPTAKPSTQTTVKPAHPSPSPIPSSIPEPKKILRVTETDKIKKALGEYDAYMNRDGKIFTYGDYNYLPKSVDEIFEEAGVNMPMLFAANNTVVVRTDLNLGSAQIQFTDGTSEVGWMAKRVGDKVAYCIEKGAVLGTGDNSGYNEVDKNREFRNKMTLADYFGRHKNVAKIDNALVRELYCQVMIWELQGHKVQSMDDVNGWGNDVSLSEYKAFKATVDKEFKDFNSVPSIDGVTVNLKFGESKTITDTKGILSKYKDTPSSNTSGVKVVKKGNSITLTATGAPKEKGKVQFDYPLDDSYTNQGTGFYYENDYTQDAATPGWQSIYDPPSTVITINVDLTGDLTITKSFSDGKSPKGIKFTVTGTSTAGKAVSLSGTTATSGKAVISDIPVGTYTVKETNCPTGYIKPADQKVKITAGGSASLSFKNVPQKGDVEVIKKSSDGLNLDGIKFTLKGTSTTGKVVSLAVTTDTKGSASFVGVPVGTYTLSETNCPAGYTKPADQTVKVSNATTVTKTFTNKAQVGSLVITKVFSDGRNPTGIKFSIKGTSTTGKAVSLTATVPDSKGKVTVTGVPVGTYTVSETNCPAGYVKPADQNVKITNGASASLSFKNIPQVGNIKVVKTSTDGLNLKGIIFSLKGTSTNGKTVSLTATTDAAGVATFTNVLVGTYTLSETNCPAGYTKPANQTVKVSSTTTVTKTFTNRAEVGSLIITKVFSDEKNPTGIKFSIKGISTTGKAVSLTATIPDEKGEVTVANVPVGSYTVSETNCPAGYKKPDDQKVTVKVGSTSKVEFLNKLNEGRIKLVKKCAFYNGYLSGAEYKIFKEDGTDTGFTVISDSSKWVYSPKLTLGKYYLQEVTAPDYYELNKEKIPFELTDEYTEEALAVTTSNRPFSDVYPEYVVPNSDYRAGTEVIMSYIIHNNSIAEHRPDTPLKVNLIVTSKNSRGVSTQVISNKADVLTPYFNKNLNWWKVKIPNDSKEITITCTVETPDNVAEIDTDNNTDNRTVTVKAVTKSEIPDTKFENTPSGFRKPPSSASVPSAGMSISPGSKWQKYEWIENAFVLKEYGASLDSKAELAPDLASFSAKKESDSWLMKSGYGVSFNATSKIVQFGELTNASPDMFVLPQRGNFYVPEFEYSQVNKKYRTLELLSSNKLGLAKNRYTITSDGVVDNRRIHFTPLWYPDGDYTVKSLLYDCWTPAGMIGAALTPKPIEIGGDMYDDWYINNAEQKAD